MLPMVAETSRLLRCQGCVMLSRFQAASPPHDRSRQRLGFASNADCHYSVLDVRKSATQAEIKDAFISKSKAMHPDLNPDDPVMHDRFIRLNEAYSVLSRAPLRREYDFILAARLTYQQRLHHHQGMRSADGSHGDQAVEKPFWDESIFEMRDRSQDYNRFYQEDEFYGVKGVHKVSNIHIFLACFLFMGLGIIIRMGIIQHSNRGNHAFLDECDSKARAHLTIVEKRARETGDVKQLEFLKAKVDEYERESRSRPCPSDV